MRALSASDRLVIESVTPEGWYDLGAHTRLLRSIEQELGDGSFRLMEDIGTTQAKAEVEGLTKWLVTLPEPTFLAEHIDWYWRRFHDGGHWTFEIIGDEMVGGLYDWSGVDRVLCHGLMGHLKQMLALLGWNGASLRHSRCRTRGDICCEFRARNSVPTRTNTIRRISMEDIAAIGQELMQHSDLGLLSNLVCELVQRYFGCTYVALSICFKDTMSLIEQRGIKPDKDKRLLFVLETTGRVVGHLELAVSQPSEFNGRALLLQQLLPFISIALDRSPTAKTGLVEPVSHPTSIDDRLERMTHRWSLTQRQSQVLALLARGAANKDIARELECSVGTIELHVSEILRRSGQRNRTEIVAAFWTA